MILLFYALNAAVVSFAINETSSSIFIVITEDLESMFTSCQFKVKMEWEMVSSPQTGINRSLSLPCHSNILKVKHGHLRQKHCT